MTDSALYVVFLVQYFAYLAIAGQVVTRVGVTRLASTNWSMLVPVLFIGEVAVTLLLLGRVWSPALLLFMLAVYEIPLVLNGLIRTWMRADDEAELELLAFLWSLRGRVLPSLGLRGLLVNLAVVAVVLIVSSLAYFTNPRPSPTLTTWLLSALALGFGISQLNGIPAGMSILASPTLSDRTRMFQLAARLSAIAPLVFWIAFLASALGWSNAGGLTSIGAVDFSLSPLVVILLAVFVGATTLIPFGVGVRRRGRLRSDLLNEELDWLERLTGILAIPERSNFADQLAAYRMAAGEHLRLFRDKNPVVDIDVSVEIDPGEVAAMASESLLVPFSEEETARNLDKFRERMTRVMRRDPVFRYARRLEDMSRAAEEVFERLMSQRSKTIGWSMAKSWADVLHRRQEAIEAEIRSQGGSSISAAAGGVVATAVFGVVVDQVARWAWGTMIGVTA